MVVGNSVWYYRDGKAQLMNHGPPWAATIAAVQENGLVTIGYLDGCGMPNGRSDVRVVSGSADLPESDLEAFVCYREVARALTSRS